MQLLVGWTIQLDLVSRVKQRPEPAQRWQQGQKNQRQEPSTPTSTVSGQAPPGSSNIVECSDHPHKTVDHANKQGDNLDETGSSDNEDKTVNNSGSNAAPNAAAEHQPLSSCVAQQQQMPLHRQVMLWTAWYGLLLTLSGAEDSFEEAGVQPHITRPLIIDCVRDGEANRRSCTR